MSPNKLCARRIEERVLGEEGTGRLRDTPVTIETAGDRDELLVLRMLGETVILNEREAWTLEQYIRIWRGAL